MAQQGKKSKGAKTTEQSKQNNNKPAKQESVTVTEQTQKDVSKQTAKPEKKPIRITETVLRDAHQSLIATRMTTEQMLPIIDTMDQVGYHSVECWGGATFDASLRFLKEDPWERLRKLRDGFKNTKLQMLLVI